MAGVVRQGQAWQGKGRGGAFRMGPMGPDSPEMDESLRYFTIAYSDGVAVLKQSYKDEKDNAYSLYGYMNYAGEWISTPDYLQAKPFYEGLAAVCGKDGKWGMIDKTGNVVIPTVFDSISDCQDGVILAYEQKYGNCIIGKALK